MGQTAIGEARQQTVIDVAHRQADRAVDSLGRRADPLAVSLGMVRVDRLAAHQTADRGLRARGPTMIAGHPEVRVLLEVVIARMHP